MEQQVHEDHREAGESGGDLHRIQGHLIHHRLSS